MARTVKGRIAVGIFKVLIGSIILGVFGVLLWRVISSENPKHLEGITVNDEIKAKYTALVAQNGFDDRQIGEKMVMFRQFDDPVITKNDGARGYFAVTDHVFVDSCDQLHLLFRYNNSTIKNLTKDYSLKETPKPEDTLFDVTLIIQYDLTPDDPNDNFTNDPNSVLEKRIHGKVVMSEHKGLYNYRKYVFDGVDIDTSDKPVIAVMADVYYVNDIDYDREPYGTLFLYDGTWENEIYQPSKSEIKAMK